jgi:hypothetical protein
MPKKSTKKPIQLDREDSTEELSESMILGVTTDGECVYIHTFDNDIQALEFLETAAAGLRADILSSMYKRSMN